MPKYSRFLIALTDRVLDARAVDLEKSENIKKQIADLKGVVIQELRVQQSMQELQGIIEPLIRASAR